VLLSARSLNAADVLGKRIPGSALPKRLKTETWVSGRPDFSVFIDVWLSHNWIAGDKRLVVGVVWNRHAQMAMNQPRSMHLCPQAKGVGEVGDAEGACDSRSVIPAGAYKSRGA
jgi:hypothetical protein